MKVIYEVTSNVKKLKFRKRLKATEEFDIKQRIELTLIQPISKMLVIETYQKRMSVMDSLSGLEKELVTVNQLVTKLEILSSEVTKLESVYR